MGKQIRRTPDQIIRKLRQAEVLSGQGKTVDMVCRELGISDATYYKWRKEYEDFSAGIDEAQAEELLRQDAVIAERAVLRLINVPLTDGQFDALVSFTYNLGGGALQRSTLRRKINREEHAEVPEQFMRWVWAGGRKLKGLVRRREAEAKLYLKS